MNLTDEILIIAGEIASKIIDQSLQTQGIKGIDRDARFKLHANITAKIAPHVASGTL